MVHNLRRGILPTGMLLLLLVWAPAGNAAEFHADSAPVNVSGENVGKMVFTTNAGTLHCSTGTYTGSQSAKTATELTVTPSYSGCTLTSIFGSIAATVNMTSCKLRWSAFTHDGHITCNTLGDTIDISMPGCTIKAGAQTMTHGLDFDVTLFHSELDVEHNMTGIHYTYSGFVCGNGTGTNGTLVQIAKITATNALTGGRVNYWWE